MGRELRMVPPHWEHPQDDKGHYKPMHDETFAHAAAEWKREFQEWESGSRGEYWDPSEFPADFQYWEWSDNPPEREYYRTYSDEEATWFQLYENVSEGTPVTPPFATKDELVNYLVEQGTFWDPERKWSRQAAEDVVSGGYCPSMAVVGGKIYVPGEDMPL